MQKLLLLEDDISLIDGLTYSLKKNGFEIRVAKTVREAENLLAEEAGFDLLLFDVTLPDGNGFTLCEKLREAGNPVPIIFLTASDEETSVIRGLDRLSWESCGPASGRCCGGAVCRIPGTASCAQESWR